MKTLLDSLRDSARSSGLLVLVGWLAISPVVLLQEVFGQQPGDDSPPAVQREFRAAWIATVANIDWPSRPGLAGQQQQQELIALLDCAVELRLNAVILQVRPAADALYASKLEPWSAYLSGTMGKPPAPYYDPLEFAVREAHRRGIELHAWFNPYRVQHPDAKGGVAPNHASRTMPDVVKQYGKYLWFDPGEPASIDRFLAVVADVVARYDVDGVHLDDYFYPYPINDDAGKPVPFPDDGSYERAVAAGETLERDDWRRQNVDRLVERMYREVKRLRPEVKVGISPFGIWRPGNPPGITGFDQYASLYADARKWLREGWVDYFTPQLYWPIDKQQQSYPKLLAWWAEENVHGRELWPGNYTSRVRTSASVPADDQHWEATEILRQIEATRAQPGARGNVHFSMKALAKDYDGLAAKLRENLYAKPALVPPLPGAEGPIPATPQATAGASRDAVTVRFDLPGASRPWLWVVQLKRGDRWEAAVVPGHERRYTASAAGPRVVEASVSAVSRTGLEGPATRVLLQRD
ncbi:MAG: family 10 glycosylhydrolase [Pirellulales bacterium]|nr:family 10 glycosylhydrolase [Pirellulales bacterium]